MVGTPRCGVRECRPACESSADGAARPPYQMNRALRRAMFYFATLPAILGIERRSARSSFPRLDFPSSTLVFLLFPSTPTVIGHMKRHLAVLSLLTLVAPVI